MEDKLDAWAQELRPRGCCISSFTLKILKDYCKKKGIEQIYAPKRLTNLIQPADVMWFALIKMFFGVKWNK